MFVLLQLTSEISHLRLGLLVEGFSRSQSEPDVDEVVKKAAEHLASKTGATLRDVSVPMHLDCKSLIYSFHFFGEERHCESEVPCLKTCHNDIG